MNKIEDVSREGPNKDKAWWMLKLLRPKNNYAFAKLDQFTDFILERVEDVLERYINGMILDIDECVAFHNGSIRPEFVAHCLSLVEQGIKICIFSNKKANDRYDELLEKGNGMIVLCTSTDPKPGERGFEECCELLGLPKDEVVMAGDNHITDGGSVRAGIPFARINPLYDPEQSFIERMSKPKRAGQIILRALMSRISDITDLVLQRSVLKPQK